MDESAVGLILKLHGDLLRSISGHRGQHYQGLAQASRGRCGVFTSATARRLRELDVVSGWIRHVTAPRCASLVQEVRAQLDLGTVASAHQLSPCQSGSFGMDGVLEGTAGSEFVHGRSSGPRSEQSSEVSYGFDNKDGDFLQDCLATQTEAYDIGSGGSSADPGENWQRSAATQTEATGLNMMLLKSLPEIGEWMKSSCDTDIGFRAALLQVASMYVDHDNTPGGSLTDSPPALEYGACTAGSGNGDTVFSGPGADEVGAEKFSAEEVGAEKLGAGKCVAFGMTCELGRAEEPSTTPSATRDEVFTTPPRHRGRSLLRDCGQQSAEKVAPKEATHHSEVKEVDGKDGCLLGSGGIFGGDSLPWLDLDETDEEVNADLRTLVEALSCASTAYEVKVAFFAIIEQFPGQTLTSAEAHLVGNAVTLHAKVIGTAFG